MVTLTLRDAIPSGKNQIEIAWLRGRLDRHPNRRFEQWRAQAGKELLAQIRPIDKPLCGPLRMICTYRPQDRRRRDLPGMCDALFHLFEYCGLVEDDSQINTLRWTELPACDGEPCIRLTLCAKR